MTTHLRRPAPSTPLFSASFLAVLAAFTTPTAAAQDAATQLETVVVTASRSDTRLQDMPLHTTVLTQEDIRRSPAQTLDQLLRNVSGLLVPGSPAYTTDPTGHNIKFRGMDKKVLVLVDGVPALDPFYTTIQWFKVPLSAIERVEIVRGGGSSLWGNLAVGGVINVISVVKGKVRCCFRQDRCGMCGRLVGHHFSLCSSMHAPSWRRTRLGWINRRVRPSDLRRHQWNCGRQCRGSPAILRAEARRGGSRSDRSPPFPRQGSGP